MINDNFCEHLYDSRRFSRFRFSASVMHSGFSGMI